MRQDELEKADARATMSARQLVEGWLSEIQDGTAEGLLRMVWSVVQRHPLSVYSVQAVRVADAVRCARPWLEQRDQPDEQRLERAMKVRLDVPSFVWELRRSGLPVPKFLGGTAELGSPRSGSRDDQAEHSADFSWAWWFGTEYTFNPNQARIIELLWREWEQTGGGLAEHTILDAVVDRVRRYGEGPRLRNYFGGGKIAKQHPAWNTMIKRIAPATYALRRPTR